MRFLFRALASRAGNPREFQQLFCSCAGNLWIGPDRKEEPMILLLIVIILLIAAWPAWPYSRGWGYYPSGGLGLILIILLILLLVGRL